MQKNKFNIGDRIKNSCVDSITNGSYGIVIGFHRKHDIVYVRYDDGSYMDFNSQNSPHTSIDNMIKIECCGCKCSNG